MIALVDLFRRPVFVSIIGCERTLVTRYRKGLDLIAWLVTQGNPPQRRHAIAELLQHGLDDATARANQRVVINDLVTRLSTLGIPDTLEAGRGWIELRTGGRLVTDDMLMLDPAIAAIFSAALAQRVGMPWCEIDGLGEESDFGDWPTPATPGSLLGTLHQSRPPATTCVAWRYFLPAGCSCCRCGMATSRDPARRPRGGGVERRAPSPRVTPRTNRSMADGLDINGAVLACSDAAGASFVFGLYARSAGFRLQAPRAALASLEIEPLARICLTSGYLFVESGSWGFQALL